MICAGTIASRTLISADDPLIALDGAAITAEVPRKLATGLSIAEKGSYQGIASAMPRRRQHGTPLQGLALCRTSKNYCT